MLLTDVVAYLIRFGQLPNSVSGGRMIGWDHLPYDTYRYAEIRPSC